MRMDNADPPRADVDRDGTHLVIRAAHLRDLDVPDPRLTGRDDAELDDAIRDELLDAGPRETPQVPRPPPVISRVVHPEAPPTILASSKCVMVRRSPTVWNAGEH